MTDDFIHLHTHSDHSMLDGAQSVTQIAETVRKLGQQAVALTDHGSLYGIYKFVKACHSEGIKPIVGSELYVAPTGISNDERSTQDGFSGRGSYSHLTVLATNSTGLRHLYRLSADSYADGFYYKPRTDVETLGELREGLIIGSGCLSGELATRIKLEQTELADEYVAKMKSVFGEAFFIEVMNHEFELEERVLAELLSLSKRHGVRLLGTNDSHYALASGSGLHDAMLCLSTYAKLSDEKRMRFDGQGYYLKSRSEMERVLPAEALDNTLLVAEQVSDYGDVLAHRLRMPASGYENPTYELWSRITNHGMYNYGDYQDRARYELDIICSMGFVDYFLVLADILAAARTAGIPVGPGRGSAGGSLVSFLLGITRIDPIELDLSFERFLNAERVSLPDIDIDIPDDRRDELVKIAGDLYGQDRTARIGTTNTIKSRAAIKDSARVLEYPVKTADALIACLPRALYGRTPTLSELDMGAASLVQGSREILQLAGPLEGLARTASQHAAGVVISPEPLVDVLPLWNAKVTGTTHMSRAITQWDMHAVEELGLVKYDFLGLNNLGVIDECLRTLRSRQIEPVSLEMGFDLSSVQDRKTFDLLAAGESVGVFQLDGKGMQALLRRLAPSTLHDIAAVLALYRPGPMGVNAHGEYADRKNHRSRVQYPHEELRSRLADILGPTYGLIVYQEQVTACLVEICGYTVNEADSVRKAMGKKDRSLLAREERRVVSTPGFTTAALQALWDTLVPFADYAFNKSHAYGYAFVSYWTAFLKANYPKEYFATVLSREGDPAKKLEYMNEVRRLGIAILPPDVNTSGIQWTADTDGVRYGLATIKGVGPKVIEKLQASRPYVSWPDFLRRAPGAVSNVKVVAALLHAGALDSLGSREGIALVIESHLEEAKQEREERRKGELGLRIRTFLVPANKSDYTWRKAREKEVLGLSISEPPVMVIVPTDLSDSDWEYIRSAVRSHPGMSQFIVKCGPWKLPYGQVDSDEILRSLKPLGGQYENQ